ncbi:MAG: hypothetical protein Q8Q28_13005 [Pseudomonadota bacterium]|nr:hypothetical protein [Pseudomonadota bacterium]
MYALSSLLIGQMLAAWAGSPAWAVDYLSGPEDYRPLLSRLRAGDHLLLRAGDNLTGGVDTAARFLKKPFAELGQLDLAPRMTLAGEVWPERLGLNAYPDSDQDFDGRLRRAPVLGACYAEAEMPCPKR